MKTREWRVVVHSGHIGDTGSVIEASEELARCAALSRYGTEEDRGASNARAIFEDDDFDVRPA